MSVARHRVVIIAKERPFDEEQWKQLLTAFAYVLHERRKAQEASQAVAQQPATPEPEDAP